MINSLRQCIAFNKKGDKAAYITLHDMYYLESEREHINKRLFRQPQYDGIVLIVDWSNQQVKIHRYAQDD